MLNNRVVLITGGTGSFGKKFTEVVLKNYEPKKLIVLSRDEFKQYQMAKTFPDTIDSSFSKVTRANEPIPHI